MEQPWGENIAKALAPAYNRRMGSARATNGLTISSPLSRLDIAGAFGDVGVLFPIAIPLSLLHLDSADLWRVLPLLVVPQFALTFGNSIVASENTARILYIEQANRVSARSLAASIAAMNVFSAAILGSPLCHGSGGITDHYKFGARTPKSNYVIGAVCLLLAAFGTAAIALLHLIPLAILGVFLIYVGVQHSLYLRDIAGRLPSLVIALFVGIVAALTTNLMWGFFTGLVLQICVRLGQSAARTRGLIAKEN